MKCSNVAGKYFLHCVRTCKIVPRLVGCRRGPEPDPRVKIDNFPLQNGVGNRDHQRLPEERPIFLVRKTEELL